MHSHKIARTVHTVHSAHTPTQLIAALIRQYSNLIIELHIEFAAVSAFTITICMAHQHSVSTAIGHKHANKSPVPCGHSTANARSTQMDARKQWKTKTVEIYNQKVLSDDRGLTKEWRMDYDGASRSSSAPVRQGDQQCSI